MADTKISALPAATLPLAGTEVLPIVQGGTTDKVSVANLTVGRTQTSNGIVQGTAETGYNFTANTPAAGMTSQLLNWYEEGTFTPTLAGSTGNPTATYTAQVGYYTRVGRLVNVYIQLFTSGYSGGSGNLQIKSLPFAATNGARFDINTVRITFGASAVQVCAAVDGGSTTIYFDESNSGATDTTLALSAWNSGASAGMTIFGSYIV